MFESSRDLSSQKSGDLSFTWLPACSTSQKYGDVVLLYSRRCQFLDQGFHQKLCWISTSLISNCNNDLITFPNILREGDRTDRVPQSFLDLLLFVHSRVTPRLCDAKQQLWRRVN